jgi:mRNA interferase MazF
MITSQLRHQVERFDEVVRTSDDDFGSSGLKTESLIRIGRLAVVNGSVLLGAIGDVSPRRVERIKRKIAAWVLGEVEV